MSIDPVWHRIRSEATDAIASEPLMGGLLHSGILHHKSLESALSHRIAMKLASAEMSEQILRELADSAMLQEPDLAAIVNFGIRFHSGEIFECR